MYVGYFFYNGIVLLAEVSILFIEAGSEQFKLHREKFSQLRSWTREIKSHASESV